MYSNYHMWKSTWYVDSGTVVEILREEVGIQRCTH